MDLEDYSIQLRMGRSHFTRHYNTGGKQYRYVEEYKTNKGIFSQEKWKEVVMKAIVEADAVELLEKIKTYCRKNCAWLRKEGEIEEYAMDCLCSRTYLHWENFEQGTIIWM